MIRKIRIDKKGVSAVIGAIILISIAVGLIAAIQLMGNQYVSDASDKAEDDFNAYVSQWEDNIDPDGENGDEDIDDITEIIDDNPDIFKIPGIGDGGGFGSIDAPDPCDLNKDGVVDINDFDLNNDGHVYDFDSASHDYTYINYIHLNDDKVFYSSWLSSDGDINFNKNVDFDGSGSINFIDLNMWCQGALNCGYLETDYPPMLGDLDHDYDIDNFDYIEFSATFGRSLEVPEDPDYNPEADYDDDNTISFVDYQKWMEYFWSYCSSEGDINGDSSVDRTDYKLFTEMIGEPASTYLSKYFDYDNDGNITFVDYQIWLSLYRKSCERAGDLNYDGVVNESDFDVFLSSYDGTPTYLTDPKYSEPSDFDDSLIIDYVDYEIWFGHLQTYILSVCDLNGDEMLSDVYAIGSDLAMLNSFFATAEGNLDFNFDVDYNIDGEINSLDVDIWMEYYNTYLLTHEQYHSFD